MLTLTRLGTGIVPGYVLPLDGNALLVTQEYTPAENLYGAIRGVADSAVPLPASLRDDQFPQKVYLTRNARLFTATYGGKSAIWRSDGTAAGTRMISDQTDRGVGVLGLIGD